MSLIKFVFSTMLILSNEYMYAQKKEQRDVIKSSIDKEDSLRVVNEINKRTKEREDRIIQFLKKNPRNKRSFKKNGKLYYLHDVTKDGKPIYITTKNKITNH